MVYKLKFGPFLFLLVRKQLKKHRASGAMTKPLGRRGNSLYSISNPTQLQCSCSHTSSSLCSSETQLYSSNISWQLATSQFPILSANTSQKYPKFTLSFVLTATVLSWMILGKLSVIFPLKRANNWNKNSRRKAHKIQ